MDAYENRVQFLNDREVLDKSYVLYWMQHSQRVEDNHAFEFAITQANILKKPLLVCFGITSTYPDANARHYAFMLEGLHGLATSIREKNVAFIIGLVEPILAIKQLSDNACMVVVDRGYLTIERQWRTIVAEYVPCSMIQIETDIVVPVEVASIKQEYSAATLRRKISPIIDMYAQLPIPQICEIEPSYPRVNFETMDLSDRHRLETIIHKLPIDHSIGKVDGFTGGTQHANALLDVFIESILPNYRTLKGDPSKNMTSKLSPYLHFGHISPIRVYRAVKEHDPYDDSGFLEELVVRRELAINFCYYNSRYDSYEALPNWAKTTLDAHRYDTRPAYYSDKQLIESQTEDPYWNAAQKQLVICGFMHGYMRMYWAKKILEWKESPEQAYSLALQLNNTYGLDGRDPNGYAGVAWCFGLHDRPWKERSVFGNVRYMNDRGLERKFKMADYVEHIHETCT
ncbi:MAG: deoxyribodipyrimidine photo-lyase [Sphaerochaetaceae bacterium]|nr:deoxyribodipyrimidine photo-lyase [Sphaerochaetaceae bacterium]MDD2404844.1 deoxyribodipyrimidine photo-lyase [Sphaerochaetaceae bacterium]MDD4258468.1 deoxyribodipyrimidine photo-lyase [Sphaerochaetaceae bacterium]MDX9934695.1 deoxyribodipyrimidine photo-lyase [Sphaerochaetaceae bacterium]NLO60189.1 deoxyribodipyrimidine photolyase [Spirochaetales bacterium]